MSRRTSMLCLCSNGYILLRSCLDMCSSLLGQRSLSPWMFSPCFNLWGSLSFFVPKWHLHVPCTIIIWENEGTMLEKWWEKEAWKKKLGKRLLGKLLLSSCRVCFAPYAFISPLTHGSAAVAWCLPVKNSSRSRHMARCFDMYICWHVGVCGDLLLRIHVLSCSLLRSSLLLAMNDAWLGFCSWGDFLK
jgi:hypothetical protein